MHAGREYDARELYHEYVRCLIEDNRTTKIEQTIQASHNVAGVDLQIDLVSILRETKNINIVHQFTGPVLADLFHQAVKAVELTSNSFISDLVDMLLPRVKIDTEHKPGDSQSYRNRPEKLVSTLDELAGNSEASISIEALLPSVEEDKQRRGLQAIWEERVHGTRMYRGANYGIRCAILYLLEMLEGAAISSIEIEGIEDFDIYYDPRSTSFPHNALPPRAYVQAKSRDPSQPAWSIAELAEVLNNFAKVHVVDPLANFLFLTDHHFGQNTTLSGILDYTNLWEFDQSHPIQSQILQVIQPEYVQDTRFDLNTFLMCIHFRVHSRDLTYEIVDKLSAHTGSPKGVASRYYEALFAEVHSLAETNKDAGTTKSFSKPELERFVYQVINSVDISAIDRPLRHGNLELLTFTLTGKDVPRPDPNYYLGVYADIHHILSGQDIERPEIMEELAIKLVERNFCVVRAPSGTGKTTILYRFAYKHRHSFSIHRLRSLNGNPETIQDCIRYIALLEPSAHSPLLRLIDDISRPEKQGWQELLKATLINSNVYVVATSREDEWDEFLARGINIEYIHLALSEDRLIVFTQC